VFTRVVVTVIVIIIIIIMIIIIIIIIVVVVLVVAAAFNTKQQTVDDPVEENLNTEKTHQIINVTLRLPWRETINSIRTFLSNLFTDQHFDEILSRWRNSLFFAQNDRYGGLK
jgi:hypothetical protein